MRDAGHQPAEGCEFFRFDQRVLRLLQVLQRGLRRILGAAHLLFAALALADVDVGADPAIDRAGCIAQRNGAGQERTVLPVLAAQRQLDLQ